jgi:hypothetical protein
MDDSSEPLNEFLNRREGHERAILAAIEFLRQLIAEPILPLPSRGAK